MKGVQASAGPTRHANGQPPNYKLITRYRNSYLAWKRLTEAIIRQHFLARELIYRPWRVASFLCAPRSRLMVPDERIKEFPVVNATRYQASLTGRLGPGQSSSRLYL